MVRDVASETEPDGVGQRKLEEVDETGIGHLRALSPWLLMVMMMNPRILYSQRAAWLLQAYVFVQKCLPARSFCSVFENLYCGIKHKNVIWPNA